MSINYISANGREYLLNGPKCCACHSDHLCWNNGRPYLPYTGMFIGMINFTEVIIVIIFSSNFMRL